MSHGVKIITPSTLKCVTVDEMKLHLRIDTDTTEDALIESLIYTAQEFIENYCMTRIGNTTEELYLDQFPLTSEVVLNKYPIQSITYCHYLDINGNETTLDTAVWSADTVSKPGRLNRNYARFWPMTRWINNAVWIRYVVGHGTTASDVPYWIKAAVKLMVGHWYQNRQEVLTNTHVEQLPWGARQLLDMNRYLRRG